METYFDSRLDLIQRQLAKRSEKLKMWAEETINDVFKKDLFKRRASMHTTQQFDIEMQKFKAKVSSFLPIRASPFLSFYGLGVRKGNQVVINMAHLQCCTTTRETDFLLGRHVPFDHIFTRWDGSRVRTRSFIQHVASAHRCTGGSTSHIPFRLRSTCPCVSIYTRNVHGTTSSSTCVTTPTSLTSFTSGSCLPILPCL